MRVADFLRLHLDDLIGQWAQAARAQVPAAAKVAPLVLLDHLPALVAELADWLDGHAEGGLGEYCGEAREHAMDRLARDFDLPQVVDEYRLLRSVLMRGLLAHQSELDSLEDLTLEDLTLVNEAMDLALAEGVNRFSRTRERLLLREAERSRLALDAAALGTWEWFPKTGEVRWDARTCGLFGVPAKGVYDFNLFLSAIHPDDRDRVHAIARSKIATNSASDEYLIEYRAIGVVDRVERWLESRGSIIERDERGAAERVIGTVLDVTERKRIERELAEAAEFRERFVAIVSHDLRAPLTAVRMWAGLLLKSDEGAVSLRRPAEHIVANTERMARMISELLDLTRGRLGGGIPIARKPTDLHSVVPSVLRDAELTHPGRHIVSEERGHLEGDWDPDRVAQALGNLAANALEHGDPHSPVRVALLGEDDESVAIAVHNDGCVIPPEEQAHIFDPFRARRPTGGLGLGLFIASEIARAHGGRVTLTSTPTDGTTFQMMLPRHADPRPHPPGAGPAHV